MNINEQLVIVEAELTVAAEAYKSGLVPSRQALATVKRLVHRKINLQELARA